MERIYSFYGRSQNYERRLLASLFLAVCPSVRMEQLGSQWTDFREILYLRIFFFENLSRKFKSDYNITGMTNLKYTYDNTPPNSLYNEKGLRQKS